MAALVLCICACTPPDPAPPPEYRSLDAATTSLRTGDVEDLRRQLGKGQGLAAHARALASDLDTHAWLLALGALEREYDLPRAVTAMRNNDDVALAEALGFGVQALRTDALKAGGSIHLRRANSRNYYESGPQPIALLDGIDPPGLPAGCAAVQVNLWGRLEGRELRVRYGLERGGVVCLDAIPELGRTEFTLNPGALRYQDAHSALPRTGPAAGLNLACLADARWYAAQFVILAADGGVQRILLVREDGWGVQESEFSTMASRLQAVREQRLNVIRRKASDMLRSTGRWPRGLADLNLGARELSDPVPDPWAEFATTAGAGFELAPDQHQSWYAACTQREARGRLAIGPEGQLLWID